MKTKKFENRITNILQENNKIWLNALGNRMTRIKLLKFKQGTNFCGIDYVAIATYDVMIIEDVVMFHVCQRGCELDFYYFNITADESSNECLDFYYQEAILIDKLKAPI